MAENMDPKENDNFNNSYDIAGKTENVHSLNSENVSANDFKKFSKILVSKNEPEVPVDYSNVSRKDLVPSDFYSGSTRNENESDAERVNNLKMSTGENPGAGIENFNWHWLIVFAAVVVAIYFNLANGTSLEFALGRAVYCAGIFWVIAEFVDFIILKMK